MTLTAATICTLDDFLTGEIDLCSPPEIFIRISHALDDPMNGAKEIAAIIQHDPSLSARMLKIVNSAFFGFPATIKTIDHAISVLGNREIKTLVMTTSVVEKFSNMPNSILDMREFWAHSLKTALFAKFLADNHPKKRQLSSVFVSGLLHDIGRLILYTKAPDLARAAALLAKTNDENEIEAEISTFGFSHADIGGALLAMWKIPESIQTAAAFHHKPELATIHKDETNIIYLANKLAHLDTDVDKPTEEAVSPSDPIWDKLDMPYEIVSLVSADVKEQFSCTYALFFGK